MFKHLLSGLVMAAIPIAAQAAPTINFTPGFSGIVGAGSLVQDFGTAANASDGVNASTYTTSQGDGARPAFGSIGDFEVVGSGGTFDYLFAAPVSFFDLVVGSLDSYNTLKIFSTSGTTTLNGCEIVGCGVGVANGDQSSPLSNGIVRYSGSGITGFEATSAGTAFEFDAIRTGAPEPATWALLLLGFGAVGAALRARGKSQDSGSRGLALTPAL
jgi:PEP-CTERM motif